MSVPTTKWIFVPAVYWTPASHGLAAVASFGAQHDKQGDAETELATLLSACPHAEVHGVVERWMVRA